MRVCAFFGAKELLLLQQTIKATQDFRVLLGDEELQSLELRRFNDLRAIGRDVIWGGDVLEIFGYQQNPEHIQA